MENWTEISMHRRKDEKLRGVLHIDTSLGETHEWMFLELKSIRSNSASIRTHVWVSDGKQKKVQNALWGTLETVRI